MEKIKKLLTPCFIALTSLCIFILLSHILYVNISTQYPEWDEHRYVGAATAFNQLFTNSETNIIQGYDKLLQDYLSSAPPLYPFIVSLPTLLIGTSEIYKIALFSNALFYIVTILSTYFIAKKFFRTVPSLMAAFIYALYGFPLFYLHFTYSETAATAFTTLSVALLLRTENFRNTRYTVLFGLAFGAAFLTRWTTPIFIIGPAAVVVALSIIEQIKNRWKDKTLIAKNLSLLLLTLTLPFALYYIPNFEPFMKYIEGGKGEVAQGFIPELANPFSKQSMMWYWLKIAQLTFYFLALFVVGLLLLFTNLKKYIPLLVGFLLPFCFFTFFVLYRDDRFIVLLYPLIAVISAINFELLGKKSIYLNTVLIGVTIIYSLLNFFGGVWGIGPMKFSVTGNSHTVPHSILAPMPIGHPRRIWLAPISWPPKKEEGNALSIYKSIMSDWNKQEKPVVVYTFEMTQVHMPLYSFTTYNYPNTMVLDSLRGIPKENLDDAIKKLNSADYILVKDGIIDDKNTKNLLWQENNYYILSFNNSVKEKGMVSFVKIDSVHVPYDHSTVSILKRIKQDTKTETEVLKEQLQ